MIVHIFHLLHVFTAVQYEYEQKHMIDGDITGL